MGRFGSRRAAAAALFVLLPALAACGRLGAPRHNVLIFVADGLRYASVTDADAPAMAAVRREGVDFRNSHSVFPSITTPNAAAIATGRFPGDSGDFANSVYAGAPALPSAFLSQVAGLEDDPVLGDMDARFGGNYLGRPTLLAAARAAGFQTAVVGKLGPALVQDPTARDGRSTVVVDDATGQPEGVPLPAWVRTALVKAGLGGATPDRGLNSSPGDALMAGVQVANTAQQDWLVRVAAEVLLPRFAAARKPWVMVFWSRDPDGTQHGQGDSLNTLQPGINGPTSRAAVRNADGDLARLRATLARLGLDRTTDVVVTSDHGFSTLSRQSASSPAARRAYVDTPRGFLPAGFLALDLGRALGLPVWEPNGLDIAVLGHPKHASALLGRDPKRPDVVIGANGGADMIWLPTPAGRALAPRIADAATRQDYLGALFADDALGSIAGALPTSALGWRGAARTPAPDMAVVFRSGPIACGRAPELCGVEVADNELQQGQGIHGSLGRADTRNMMAAAGPDFRRGFADVAPAGNVDWAPTLAHLLGLKLDGPGMLKGRVLEEALARGRPAPAWSGRRLVSAPAASGFRTVLDLDVVSGGPAYVRSSPRTSPAR